MMNMNRRDLCVALSSFAALAAALPAEGQQGAPTTGGMAGVASPAAPPEPVLSEQRAYPFDKLPVKTGPNGESRGSSSMACCRPAKLSNHFEAAGAPSYFSCGRHGSGYDDAMSDPYGQLLDATIQHLEDLKSRGARHVAVSSDTLRALSQPVKSQISNLKSQLEKPAASGAPVSDPARTKFLKRAGSRRRSGPPPGKYRCFLCQANRLPPKVRRSIRRQKPPRLPRCANARWPA